jgi:hypothetical protein
MTRQHQVDPRSAPVLMESGRMRRRRTFLDPLELIAVSWNFTEDQFEAFKTFFEIDLQNGSEHFELITPDFPPAGFVFRTVTRVLAFWECNYAFTRSDNLFSVTATLEVVSEFTSDANPPEPEIPLPDPEITYPSDCRDTFVFTFHPLAKGKLYCIQAAVSSTGPWAYHVFVPIYADYATGPVSVEFNNDYDGLIWFRAITGRRNPGTQQSDITPITKAKCPQASVVRAPRLSVHNTRNVLEPFDPIDNFNYPRPFWAPALRDRNLQVEHTQDNHDGHILPTRVHDIPYALSVIENSLFAPTSVYQMPRYRVEWTTFNTVLGGGNSPDLADLDTTVTVDAEGSSVTKWTRDGSDPTEFTVIPTLDGLENNAGVWRHDFAYVIRARSFKEGCRSPLTTLMVDKRIPHQPYLDITVTGASLSGSCDLTTNTWDPDLVESANSCKNLYGDPTNYEKFLVAQAYSNPASSGGGNNLLDFGTGSISEHVDFLGWMNHEVVCDEHKFASAVLHREPTFWNDYNPHARIFVIVENEKLLPDMPFFIGCRKTQGLIGPSKYFPDTTLPGAQIDPAWLGASGAADNGGSISDMISLGLYDTRFALGFALSVETYDPVTMVDQFGLINYTMFPSIADPYGIGYDFRGHLTKLDLLLTVHDDTRFFGERLNYWFTDPDLHAQDAAPEGVRNIIKPQFRSAFYRPYCIWDEDLIQDEWHKLSDPDTGIPYGLVDLPAWGPIWDFSEWSGL